MKRTSYFVVSLLLSCKFNQILSEIVGNSIDIILNDYNLVNNDNFESEIDNLLLQLLQPEDIYIEINPTSQSRLNSISQHLTSTGLILVYDRFNTLTVCPQVPHPNIICTSSEINQTIPNIDEIASVGSNIPYLHGKFPSVIQLSSSDLTIIANTQTLQSFNSLFFIQLKDQSQAKEVIKLFIFEGYDVFWHISWKFPPTNSFLKFSSLNELQTTLSSLLIVSLIAIPIKYSNAFKELFASEFSTNLLFPSSPEGYFLENYDLFLAYSFEQIGDQVHFANEVSPTSQLKISEVNIWNGQQILQTWCPQLLSQSSSFSFHQIRLFQLKQNTNMMTNSTMNRMEQFCSEYPSTKTSITTTTTTRREDVTCSSITIIITLDEYEDMKQNIQLIVPAIFQSSVEIEPPFSSYHVLKYPTNLSSLGLKVYTHFYCHQLLHPTSETFPFCLEYLERLYSEVQRTDTCHCSLFELLSNDQSNPSTIDLKQLTLLSTHQTNQKPLRRVCSTGSIWCNHTVEFQNRLQKWQNPQHTFPVTNTFAQNLNQIFAEQTEKGCKKSKFLLFEPATAVHGIGSILLQIATALRFALCHGRILYLLPSQLMINYKTHQRWMLNSCTGSIIDCYFEPISDCQLTDEEIRSAFYLSNAEELDSYPYRNERLIALAGLPLNGHCSICGSEWSGDFSFFDGLNIKQQGHPFAEFLGKTKLPWLAQTMRYSMKPRKWFNRYMKEIARSRLNSSIATSTPAPSPSSSSSVVSSLIPQPFASIHIRYGEKFLETPPVPLTNYMEIVMKRAPHIRNIFISTETESVIQNLTRTYPNYSFYWLNQKRYEVIHSSKNKHEIDFTNDFILSITNLFISIDAKFFVGSLTSSWCTLINTLQRTRGDGGSDYHSVDSGTSYTVCY